MKKHIFLVFTIILMFTTCGKDEPTKTDTNPIVGKWILSTMKVDGVVLNYMEENEIPYQLEFYSDGRGNVWIKDYGQTTDDSPIAFTWSTGGNTLYIQQTGTSQLVMQHNISSNKLTLTMADGSELTEYIYNKS